MRVLLFGIDGLAFRVLDPMIERGLLPNFARVRNEGAQGILRSTTPPMTPPAWMSIATGLLPAGHGVYDFWGYEWKGENASTREGSAKADAINRVGTAIWNGRGKGGGLALAMLRVARTCAKADAINHVATNLAAAEIQVEPPSYDTSAINHVATNLAAAAGGLGREGDKSRGRRAVAPRFIVGGPYDARVHGSPGGREKKEGPVAYVMTHRRGGKAIWNILSEWGKKVVVANVPLTYPPEPVNGIMLSGYMAPDTRANVTYPSGFKDELLRVAPDYQIDLDPAVSGGQIGDPLAETLKMTRARLKMFRLALSKGWDFCFLACSGADRIQHLRWDAIMDFHPQAVAYYQMLDEALGMMLDELHSDDLLLIVSDHGFRGVRRKFYVQEYLHRLGLLRMRHSGNRYRAQALGQTRAIVRNLGLQQPARLLRSLLRKGGIIAVEKVQHAVRLPDLDWAHTRAWIPSASGSLAGYADIFLHDRLAEEDIKGLMQTLGDVVDPESGEPLFVEMHREDVYGAGPFAPPERHLIVLANEQTTLATELGRGELWENSDVTTGIHHPDGVLYLYGAGVKRGLQIEAAHVCDIVPTILARMDVPRPDELNGRVIEEAFERVTEAPGQSADEGIVRRKLRGTMKRTR